MEMLYSIRDPICYHTDTGEGLDLDELSDLYGLTSLERECLSASHPGDAVELERLGLEFIPFEYYTPAERKERLEAERKLLASGLMFFPADERERILAERAEARANAL